MGGVAIVVFSDLVDSTALLARLGDDRMDRVRRAHIEDVTDAVERNGGRVIKTLGDGVMSSFESALGALRAAAAIQAAVERLDAEHGGIDIAARVGVAAGEPIPDGEDLHGMAVVIASRLSSTAETSDVLVQDLVQALVASRDGVRLEEACAYDLKGVPAPVRASRLLWRELAPQTGDGDEPADTDAGSERSGHEDGERGSAHIRFPPGLAAYAEEPLIGRDREIAMLRETTAPRPGRRAVVILGEPGIGKTRHAAAAASEAHALGATVALARCPPETIVPFEPWVRAIGELALAGDDAWCETLAAAAGPELSGLVPELGRHARPDERAGASEFVAAEGARYRLLRGIGAALACAAKGGPLQVVLDDAHWCDPASAQALGHLLESAPTGELVLVVTARDEEMDRGHPVSRVLSDLRRTGDLSELRLEGLDARGMAALVDARVGRPITPALATRLLARTSGNPFFAGELARDLDEQGVLRDDEALDAAPVPDAVAGLVEERLAQLDPATERLLSAAAAIGPSAPIALAAKAAGLEQVEAEQAARAALSERLVEDVAVAEPTIAFTHALVREALAAKTGDAARARLHLAIARALEEDPAAEPAELARHYGLSVELAGAEPAIKAYRAAATSAADGHDHEQAASHLHQVLSLLSDAKPEARATTLLELGEQELLTADLVSARRSFLAAVDAARATGDTITMARAALGFAGGDIGFGWELSTYDPKTVVLLWEGLEALGDSEPRLALRMVFRLAYLLVFSDDEDVLTALAQRAGELEEQLGDAEARILARFTAFFTRFARDPDPLDAESMFKDWQDASEMVGVAEESGREDLLFRLVQWSAAIHYLSMQTSECDRAIERAAEIAQRLGSPRFTWEVDLNRGMRLLDRGEREAGEALVRRAGAVVRRLRPDIHIQVELYALATADWLYGGQTATLRLACEALEEAMPRGLSSAASTVGAALDGDVETARHQLRSLLTDDLEPLRRPDGHLPQTLFFLAQAATVAGDLESGEKLRPLLEPMRSYLVVAVPALSFGTLPEAIIGRLELLAGRTGAAVEELRAAVAKADALELVWASAWHRVDLATALHRSGDKAHALATLEEGEAIAMRHGVGWASKCAAEARAEIEGRERLATTGTAERSKPIRALATRGGRRALAAIAGDLDDEAIERRFLEPRRQRALMKTLARGFQPAHAAGFSGVIAYELEPLAIEPRPDSPWRWAIEVDADSGRARLLEPAPLNAAVTLRLGLADWVRVLTGSQNALAIMAAGRCSVEGDVLVAARLEAMFGGR
jgi:class 3 adenylate cyclase